MRKPSGLRTTIWTALAIVGALGCQSQKPTAEISANQPTQAFVPKPTVAAETEMTVSPDKPIAGTEIKVNFIYRPRETIAQAHGQLTPKGVIALKENSEIDWTNLQRGGEYRLLGTFLVKGPGEGEIRGEIQTASADGQPLYAKASYLYFLVRSSETLISTNSIEELRGK